MVPPHPLLETLVELVSRDAIRKDEPLEDTEWRLLVLFECVCEVDVALAAALVFLR